MNEDPGRQFRGALYAVLELSSDIVCICHDERITAVNHSGARLLGADDPKRIKGRKFEDFVSSDYAMAMGDLLEILLEEREPFPMKLMALNGKTIDAEVNVQRLKDAGEGAVVIVAKDITNRVRMSEAIKRNEERYRQLVNSALGIICLSNHEKITYVNQAGVERLGYDGDSEIIGRPVADLFHRDYRDIFAEGLAEVAGEGTMLPARLVRKNGTFIDAEVSIAPFKGGKPGDYMIEAQDITEHNQAVAAVHELNQSLEKRVHERTMELVELNELKNKFLGIAAHDLRNPITSIRGMSQLILEMDLPETKKTEMLTSINKVSNQMLNLLNDLLDVSVIESGKFELKLKTESLTELMENRVELITFTAEPKNIKIAPTIEEVPEFDFDQERITQVIDNLLSNAIKFSPGGTTVHVRVFNGDGVAHFEVRDEGPGIPADELDKLFGMFQKLSVRPTGGEKSTGLGLAIVKKIVDAHGGEIKVTSTVGEGTTFSVSLPMNN